MFGGQLIPNPFGISVFGSSIIRVMPDIAVISFAVTRVEERPKQAFEAVRQAAQKVQTFLANHQIRDAGASRISLQEEYRHEHNVQKFVGYRTRIDFRIIVPDLTQVEPLLVGLIDAGVTQLGAADFQSTHLKDIRAEARRQAIVAAREKALNYCAAAGVELGEILHIEDMNPDWLRGGGHRQVDVPVEDNDVVGALNPSSIVIGGAVMVAYKIRGQESPSEPSG